MTDTCHCPECGNQLPALPPKPPDLGRRWALEWERDGHDWRAKCGDTRLWVTRSEVKELKTDIYCAVERQIGTYPNEVEVAARKHLRAEELPEWLAWALEAVTGATIGGTP